MSFAFGSVASAAPATPAAPTSSTTPSGFMFGGPSTPGPAFGGARAPTSAPSTTLLTTPGPVTSASLAQDDTSKVSAAIFSHDFQRLDSFRAATHSTTFNTFSTFLVFSILFRSSTSKANSLDALIVIQSAVGKPIAARFAISFTVTSQAGASATSSTHSVVSPYSPATKTRVTSPSVIETVCDLSNQVPLRDFAQPVPTIKIDAVTVSIDHSPFIDPSTSALACIDLDTSHLALLATLDDPKLSDCALLAKDSAKPIHVSRAILAHSSPFFHSMLCGPWAESVASDTPVQFGWSTRVLVICLIHVYSGGRWMPEQVPKSKAVKGMLQRLELGGLMEGMTRHLWNEVIDLAVMLELFALAKVANRKLANLLQVECEELEKKATESEKLKRDLLVEE
ncbi:hypothetical protein BCR44DRAFT_35065 [Catenaria anguillulae PL171]|uniref:BTB domain-containing protein n=1 Tax=Catenaria anguillulae PL171 TaxID=765915 RepID=A0A1Y2HEF9_9FUNG|nr:hypothetical protein BCR44DRAFT_35065 [Catenaria anguillulae PL171]